jgi:uncharacterized protein with von Willebrand factor type A (vWA) domain
VFSSHFKAITRSGDAFEETDIPKEWLEKLAERHLDPKEREAIKALGWDKLWETLAERLKEQKGRHQGGSKWIGTAGTSPFGAYGTHKEGIRIGQEGNRNFSAIKVWDKREFKDLDDNVELGTRAIKIALRRLRRFARTGSAEELDLDNTIRGTAEKGFLDVRMRPERRNAIKLLLFLDVGGSMDYHIERVEELFSAVSSEFKHLEFFYFHNCPYERLWKNNRRRHEQTTPTWDVIRTFPNDYKVVFVGDGAMSPYEIAMPGGSVEHWNEEAGSVWIKRLLDHFPKTIWINPVPQPHWTYSQSTQMLLTLLEGRMVPLTLDGLDQGMKMLLR